MGSAFNRSMWKGMGAIIGNELRALWLQGVGENHRDGVPHVGLDCWSPNIGIVRDPRWGRNLETPSEDPLVCGSFGTDVTRGLQEGPEDPRYLQAVVTLKHFDANSLEGPWGSDGSITRHTVDAAISPFDLASSYLPAFKMAVKEGKAKGIMCSYNAINGVPSCANKWLLQTTAREAWGFDGYITSDSGAVEDIYRRHKYTPDGPSGVTAALQAGCDVDSSLDHGDHETGSPYTWYATKAIQAGSLQEADLDRALRHSLSLRFQLGLFDPIHDQPYWHVDKQVIGSSQHVAEAVDAARQGFVLLQNGAGGTPGVPASSPVLPFSMPSKVAVIGPHANDREAILGNYIGQMCPDHFASVSCVSTVYEAIAAHNRRAGAHASDTTNATGVAVNSTDASGIAAALAAAKAADYVVIVAGLDGSIERESKDRKQLSLPGLQNDLISRVTALGKQTVLVLFHGGVVTFPKVISTSANLAVVSAGYPGKHGAQAIAGMLFDSPSGPAANRFGLSAVTWYSEAGWAKAAFDMLSFDMTAAPGRTYRYYQGDEAPQWAFGHGLTYGALNLSAAAVPGHASTFTATVTNAEPSVGRATDAVVLFFLSPKDGTIPASEPASKTVRRLVAFERLGPIAPQASATATMTLTAEMASMHDKRGQPKLFEGAYDLIISTANRIEVTLPVKCTAVAGRQTGCTA